MIEKTININSYDVFPNATIKPSALMKYMQQLAREDCDRIGCTYPFMRGLNTVFVTTKLGIEFYRPITVGKDVLVKTYNNSIDGIIFDREFDFYIEGEPVAHASTFWVLVKYDTRQIVRPNDFPMQFEQWHLPCNQVDVPRRIVADNLSLAENRKVRVADLDENNHLNNCIYADYIADVLPDFDGLNKTIKELKIIFRHEARLSETLAISVADGNSEVAVFADNGDTNNPCFQSLVTFF